MRRRDTLPEQPATLLARHAAYEQFTYDSAFLGGLIPVDLGVARCKPVAHFAVVLKQLLLTRMDALSQGDLIFMG